MFRLEWHRRALDDLTAGWLSAEPEQRQEITKAVAELERRLVRDPFDCGESRDKDRRIAFSRPVAITFEVHQRLKLVTILFVRIYRPRSR